ncbi:putative nucleotidyltransferase substrate binding domain-containing protein [Aquisalimonas sp.]|uniref:putative nucleotidyltransferase substrate binding domain-containing protein n=1 Tax=Aquisalimonas sp. TaxID=1872621 RepID=UPI0025C4EBEA|nr:putative nucleotidyltransferase substrate binding domain-containing protein [Aquisalimonas sp.]
MNTTDQNNAGLNGEAGELAPVVEFLRRHPPFDRMTLRHVQEMVLRLELRHYPKGARIAEPASGPASRLFIVHRGCVHGGIAEGATEEEGETWELMPGECFPVGALLSRRPVRHVHEAVEDTECLELEWLDFTQLLEISPEFNEFCTHRLSTLRNSMQREVQADALRGLGGDSSLNIALSERVRRPPVTCSADMPVRDALQSMAAAHVGSIVATDAHSRPIGVFTLKDLLTRVSLPGVSLDTPMEAVMTPDPVCVPRSSFAFEAAMIMAHHAIHHVCVVDRGRLVGVVSERDLFSLQRVGLVNLSKSIARAESLEALSQPLGDIHQLVDQMIAQGARVGQITQIITLLNDQITRRVIELCMQSARGLPDVTFAWIAFGSEARQEQTLKTDQDNGVLFQTPEGSTADAVRTALIPAFRQVNEALDQCGYPLCEGNIMASNPECCLSYEEWQGRFTRWIDQGTPKHLLQASIFFDFRTIDGPHEDTEHMRYWLLDRTARNSRFRRQLAANALQLRPPLGVFRSFRVESRGEYRNTLNLKLNGVTPFVDAARILALAHRIPATNTMERLRMAADARVVDPGDVAAWAEAYDYIQMLRMRRNQEQRAAGEALSNRIDPSELNELDRRILKEAFREARALQNKIESDYQL